MASFSSLPVELVRRIVHLSAPHFWHDDDSTPPRVRYEVLRILCLTNKLLLDVAGEVLYRQVGIKSDDRTTNAFLASKQGPNVQELYVEAAADSEHAKYPIPPPLHFCSPKVVTIEGFAVLDPLSLAGTLRAATLTIIHSGFRSINSFLWPCVSFSGLRRLSIANTLIPDPTLLFTAECFPDLRTFCPSPNFRISWDSTDPISPQPEFFALDVDLEAYPFIPQLKALGIPDVRQVGVSDSFEVLDTLFVPEWPLTQFVHLFPPTLRVLRIASNPIPEIPLPPLDDTLLATLSSPHFRPELDELHLVNWPDEDEGTARVWKELRNWGEREKVRLFVTHPFDLASRNDSAFWRFLDGVHERLGLDV
ncbi:hypothetical protein JCM8547_006953 [Rhodosporidiobolus lusitaniae]